MAKMPGAKMPIAKMAAKPKTATVAVSAKPFATPAPSAGRMTPAEDGRADAKADRAASTKFKEHNGRRGYA